MGEVERVQASYGASFGSNYTQRINNSRDRQPKKHQREKEEDHSHEDALELHDEAGQEQPVQTYTLPVEEEDHLDLSA